MVFCAGLAAGAARGAGQILSLSPTAANFGSVTVGSSKSIAVMITNTGHKSLDLNRETLIGAMYSVTGIALPKSIAAGAHVIFTVRFAPTTTGTHDGSVELGIAESQTLVVLQLSGEGVGSPGSTLTAAPNSVSFGTVAVGSTDSQTVVMKNTGGASLTISAATVSGTGFKLSGWTLPHTLAAGQSVNCTVSYTPKTTGTASGQMTVTSTASDKSLAVALSGTGGTSTRTLTATPTSLNFGNDAVGSTQTMAVTLQNTGNSSVTVSGIKVSGSGITTGGGVSGATIASGQTATLDVSFTPKQVGAVSGSLTVVSNATSSPTIAVSGDGVALTAYSVALNWNASTSSGVAGYNVYRATLPNLTYTRLNATQLTGMHYTDGNVTAGVSYSYVVTAVSSDGQEGGHSRAAVAVIP